MTRPATWLSRQSATFYGTISGDGFPGFSMPGLAWIHLVALGWLTLSSLCMLFHVLPGFQGLH